MYVDSVIIVSMIVGCLAFFLLIAIFIAVFQRELGTKHREKLEEGDVSEKQRLTPMPDEAQVEYTTETVQPESKTPVSRYPHAQVNRLFQVVWLILWPLRHKGKCIFTKTIAPYSNRCSSE